MELTQEEITQAVRLGLSRHDIIAGREAGLTMDEIKTSKRLHVGFAEYASRKDAGPVREWLDAEQSAMLAKLAAANQNTELGDRLGKWSREGLPEDWDAPLAWWSAPGFRDAAYARAKDLAGADGVTRLGRAEHENTVAHLEGRRMTAVIPKDLR